MRTQDDLFARLARSAFRQRFTLGPRDRAYLRAKGLPEVLIHARRFVAERLAPAEPATPGKGEVVLATWSQLIDSGSLIASEQYLQGTARTPVVRLSKAQASDLGVAEGEPVTISSDRGEITLPTALTADMPDTVVWLPTNSPGSAVRRTLGVLAGATVRIGRAETTSAPDDSTPDGSAGGTR